MYNSQKTHRYQVEGRGPPEKGRLLQTFLETLSVEGAASYLLERCNEEHFLLYREIINMIRRLSSFQRTLKLLVGFEFNQSEHTCPVIVYKLYPPLPLSYWDKYNFCTSPQFFFASFFSPFSFPLNVFIYCICKPYLLPLYVFVFCLFRFCLVFCLLLFHHFYFTWTEKCIVNYD